MRPLCGKKHGGNRKSQGALARLCEFPGRFRIYRAQRSQQGCSLSLGMLRLAEPPTGRARLRSSLKSPRNPITPIETSRVATLHPELYKNLREGARRVIGATAKPLYAIDGKAVGLDRRNPQTSLLEGGGPPAGGGRSSQAVEGVIPIICPTCAACVGHMIFFVSEELEWAGQTGRTAGFRHE